MGVGDITDLPISHHQSEADKLREDQLINR
jgi:hypothetical protein